MASTKGNVPVLSDGGTHHSWCWDEKNMVWRMNGGPFTFYSGDVVVKDNVAGDERFNRTATESDPAVIGVIPQVEAAEGTISDQIVGPGWTYVQFAGDISKVNVTGSVTVGDFLIAASADSKAKSCGTTWRPGIFGIATSAAAGPGSGTVSARLFPVHSQVAPWKPGDIKMHAGGTLETGWLWCNGAAVSRTTYAALFTEISTKYGVGDGSTTFNVPDLQGRIPIGVGTHADVNDFGKNEGQPTVGNRTPRHSHSVPRDGWGVIQNPGTAGRLITAQQDVSQSMATIDNTSGSQLLPFVTVKFVIKT